MQVSPSLLPLSFSLDTLFLTPFVTHHSHLFNLLSPFIFSIPLISSRPLSLLLMVFPLTLHSIPLWQMKAEISSSL